MATTATPLERVSAPSGSAAPTPNVVLEEAPPSEPPAPSAAPQLLVLSGADGRSLEAATDRLAAHLAEHPSQVLADVAHTLARGRRAFPHRRFSRRRRRGGRGPRAS